MADEEAGDTVKRAKGIGIEAIGVQELPFAIGLAPLAWRFV